MQLDLCWNKEQEASPALGERVDHREAGACGFILNALVFGIGAFGAEFDDRARDQTLDCLRDELEFRRRRTAKNLPWAQWIPPFGHLCFHQLTSPTC